MPTMHTDSLGLFISSVDAACVTNPVLCAELMGDISRIPKNLGDRYDVCVDGYDADDFLSDLGDIPVVAQAASGLIILAQIKKGGVPARANPRDLLPRQGRNEMTGSRTNRLRNDMRRNGFDESKPIDVANVRGRQVIIDGHHRAAAAGRAGIRDVPVRVHEVSESQAGQLWQEVIEALYGR